MLYTEVIVDNKIPNLIKIFDYLVPKEFENIIEKGMRVIVPFGSKNTERLGYVLALKTDTLINKTRIKTIIEILDETSFLNEELFLLTKEILKIPFISPSLVYNTIIPRSFLSTYKRKITILQEDKIPLEIKEYLIQKECLLSLKDNFFLREQIFELQKKRIIKTQIIICKKDYRPLIRNKNKIRTILDQKNNDIILNHKDSFCLNKEQYLVWKQIFLDRYDNYLLYYDHYEDKIAIYLKLIEHSLKQNKQVLIVVAEIILITFLKDKIQKYFPEITLSVLINASSLTEHYQINQDIQEQKICIVIGTRKVIFAPLKKIGVIIFDEENDESLIEKEKSPNYDSKELAHIRAKYHQVPLVFFTTMPSAESYLLINQKKIIFCDLTRKNNKTMKLIDMKQELKKGNLSPLSYDLLFNLKKNIKEKKKTILFINVLGFSSFILCRFCSYIPKCPKCSQNLVFLNNVYILKCTFCRYSQKFSSECPRCRNIVLKNVSLGIEYVLNFLKKEIPNINVESIDSNSIKTIKAYQKILKKFENNEIDILIGTEMIVKNLKLPLIETVGVLMVDALLNVPNFKAIETTFQSLIKMSNYLTEKGKIIVQGYNINHFSLQKAQYYDIFSFLEQILKEREISQNPPFIFLSKILISHKNFIKVINIAKKIKEILEKSFFVKIKILGPTYPLVFYKNKYYRVLLTLKYDEWPLNINFIIEQNLNEDAFILFDRFANII
ncbi:MAG: primosomal protein N' [Phytoplasma sp.]|uniref:replication restart helicase PriA n=1 Tax=Phytoplasma sp. TaxID=2155 RepID=UPI002B401047|nr:primosomal protein N' [Phytoplasma sp.]WRH06726.1 MAG: primosomal protein N' [Phytoplasma sp.]